MSGELQPVPDRSSVPDNVPAPDLANSPELIEQFFQLQTKEIEARIEQTRLETLKVEHGSKYSLASLDKQAAYLEREGGNHHKRQMGLLYAVSGAAAAVLIFLGILILNGHEQIALELIKLVAYTGAGGAGGYGVGRLKSGKPAPTPPSDPDED